MPAKDDITVKKRVTRKLTKRRKEGHQVTMEIPKRFDDGDDADEDCTAPKGHHVIINQSVFGMIAAAGGSQVDFNARFEGQSSDEEEEDAMSEEVARTPEKGQENKKGTAEKKPQKKFMDSKLGRSLLGRSKSKSSPRGHHFPSLVVRSSSASKDPSKDSGSDDSLDDTAAPASLKGAPIMSQMLEAKAEYAQRPSFDSRRSGDMLRDSDAGAGSSSLAMRLMEIFQFESPEDVIEG
jgi:sterol 3beta-glucosyltransferase